LVERLDARGTRRDPKALWLIWVGEEMPPLALLWPFYLRRFVVDHWYRFIKGDLLWTAPRFKTPEQGQNWSDLVTMAYWQLWLAKPVVTDRPRPWEQRLPQLTPGRVRRVMGGILAHIRTPAREPKTRGKSPGRVKGQRVGRYKRYSVVKKSKIKAKTRA